MIKTFWDSKEFYEQSETYIVIKIFDFDIIYQLINYIVTFKITSILQKLFVKSIKIHKDNLK